MMGLYRITLDKYNKLAALSYWPYLLSFACLVYVFIIAFPPFYDLEVNEVLQFQTSHLFSRLPDAFLQESHAEKHQFRIFVPFLCKLLNINGLWPLLIQYISNFFLFLFSYKLILKITNDKVVAGIFTFGTANIYAGLTGVYDVFWHFDSVAILLLVIAIYKKDSVWISFVCLLASYFTDERAFVASSMVFVYAYSQGDFKVLFSCNLFTRTTLPIIGSWCVYIIFRLCLTYYFDFYTGTRDLTTIRDNYRTFPLSWLFVFESFWVILVIALWKCRDDTSVLVLAMVSLLSVLLVAMMVIDVSRSTAYAFPILFWGVYICNRYYSIYFLRKLVFKLCLLAMVIPTQEFFNFTVYGMGPIIPKIFKMF